MQLKLLGAGLVLGLCLATNAGAQGYGGASLGWEHRSARFGLVNGTTRYEDRDASDAVTFAAFAGYGIPLLPSVSLSGEGEIGRSTGKTRLDDIPGLLIENKTGWHYLVSARPSLLLREGISVFGILGYGGDRTKIRFVSDGATLPLFSSRASNWTSGLVYGGGLSLDIGVRSFGRVEYRHREADTYQKAAQQVMLGVGYRF